MDWFEADDRLAPVGTFVGVFLIVGALGTLLGAPWATAASTLAGIVQVIGVVLVVAIGAGLIRLSALT